MSERTMSIISNS